MSTQSFSDIEFKSNPGQFNIDEAQGIVECFVAGIGNKDSVGDVLIPGAFTKSLTRRKPRVVWGHNWNDPIGKVLEIYEVPPSDPRLPNKMKAAGIGGLYARVQFNLGSEKGREAFSNVAFFGHDQEWSIGYKTLDAIFDQGIQANVLKEVELYEVSPVLHGANQLTGTISVKSDNLDEKCWPTAQGAPNSGDSEHSGLEAELMKRTGSAVKVRTASQNIAVFDRMTSDGKTSTYRIGYHFDGNQYMFGKPEAVTTQTVYTPEQGQSGSRVVVPSQMPSMPMNVKPQGDAYLGDDPGEQRPGTGIIVPPMGRILPKDASDSAFGEELDDLSSLLGDDFGAKVGKVISSRNLSKLKNVLSILEEIVVASDKDVETKSELLIPVEIENAFATKTALDPIFEYHRVETEVTEKGIVVKSGVTPDFINAINTATKGLGPTLGRGGGNLPKVRSAGRALTGTFDPNAWDGDGDGLVQEGTAFERPAVPGVNDRATGGVVNAIDAVRSAEKLGINTGNKEGLSSSRNPSSPDFYNSVGRWSDGNGLNRLDSEIMSHLIKSGDNNEDAAKHFNVPEITIELAKKRETQRLKRNDKFHRNKDILTYRMGGLSLEETAKLFGDTRENIRKSEQKELSHLRNDMSNDEFENLRRSGMTLDSLSKITGKSREELRKTEMKNRSDSRKRTQEISKANADRRDGLASRFFGGKDKTPKPDDSKAIEVPKPRKPLNTDGWKKWNSGRSGSQVGGSFEDASGNKFYVKEPHSQSHAEQEVLAAQLYRLLGVSAADVQLGDYKGKTKIVSPWIDNSKNNVLSPQKRDQAWRKKVQAGYVADAWLANWDVLGTGWDNIIADGNGDPVRVDTGGSLGYRARGAAKGSAFGNTAGEMESLLDARKNASSADYFGDIPKDEIERQVAELEKLQPDQIRQMVDGYISDKNEAKKLSDTLIARRQDIIDRYGAPKRKPIEADGLNSGTGVRQPRSRAEIDKYPRGIAPPNYPDSPSRDTFSHLESENGLTTGLGFEIPITSDDVKHSVTYSDSAMKHRQKAFEALETEDMHDGPGKALAAAKAEIVKGLAAGDISEKEAYETYHELGSRAEELINSGVGSGVELERNATALKNFKFEAVSQVDDWVNQSTRNLKDISSDINKVREEPGRVSADKNIKEAYDAIDLVGNKYGQVGWAGSMRKDNPHTPEEIMDELKQDVSDIITHLQDAEDNDPGRDHRKDIDKISKKLGEVLDGHISDGSINEKQKEELLKSFVDDTSYLAQTGETSDTVSTMYADETKLSRSRIEGLASSARTKLMSNEGVTETDKRKVQAVAARTMLNRPGQIQRDENGNIASTEARDMREKLDAGIFKKLADLGFSDDEISALTGVPNGGRPIKKGQTVNGLSSSVLSGNDKFINFDRGALENILESRNPKPKIIKPRKSSQHGPTGLEDLTDEELLAELSKHNKPAWRPWDKNSQYIPLRAEIFGDGTKDNSASFNQIVRELNARGFTVEEHGPREAKFFGDYSSGDTSYLAHNKDTGVNTQGVAAKKIINDLKNPSPGLQSSSRDDASYARELKKQREMDAARGANATNPVGKPEKQMGMNLSELDEMKKTIDRLIEGSVGATTSQDGSKDEDLRRLEELAGKIDDSHVAVDYVHMSDEELNNYMETLQNMRDEPGVQDLYNSLDKVKKSTDGVYESPKVEKQGFLDSSGKKPTRNIASSAAKRGLSRNKEISTNTHPKLEMTLTNDEIGLLRDDITAVKKFATDASALDALDGKLSGATNGKIDITNSDYDALTESIEKAKKDSNGKLITSDVLGVIGQAADSEDGKFVSPNFESEKQGLASEVPKPGRRLNNGAPSDIPVNMQKDLMYWARQQGGLRIAQDIVREHDANDGQMPPSRWKALRTMHQNMGPGSARNGMRSSVGTNGSKKPKINAAREGLSSDLGGGSLGLGDGSLNMSPTGEGGRGRGVGRAAGLGDIAKRGNEEGRQVGSGAQQDPRFVGKNFDELKPDNWDEMSTTDKLDWMFYEGSPSKSGMRQVDHTRIVNELTSQEEIDAKRAERRTRLDAQKASRPQSESMLPDAVDGEKPSAAKRTKDSSTIRKFSSTRADEMLGHVDDGKLSQTHADAWSDIEKALGDKDELTASQIKAAKDSIDKLIYDADIEGDDSRAAKYSIDQAEKLKKVLDAYDSSAPQEGMTSRTGPSEKAKKAVPSYQKYLTAKASTPSREGLRSGNNPTGKEGRTMITDEATYFKDIESSLVKEIEAAKKVQDTKTSSGLTKLQEIIRRQEASKTGDRRTNVGSIFLTQEESDQILDALMVALDRQVERGSAERQDLYSKMIEHIAKAAMSTFIDKSTREIGSRTQKRTGGRDGRTVSIPNTNL